MAIGFEKAYLKLDSPDCIFESMKKEIEKKRDYFVNVLREVGMTPIVPEGAIFVQADWTSLGLS